VLGFSLLEVVNYLEHYGLLRDKKDDGRYEPACRPQLNSNKWRPTSCSTTSNAIRPSRQSTRRYQALRHVDEAPAAGRSTRDDRPRWFPPLWRR